MEIKTLELNHKLLKEEEERTNELYRNARSLQHEDEDSEERDAELIKSQKCAADKFMDEHIKAINALNDFENKQW